MSKKAFLIGAMVVCLAGSVGTVFALTRNSAAATGTSGNFDQAINLYWGHESTTATIDNCENLVQNRPVYRYLTVSPKSSKSVAGNVTLSFTMAAKSAANFVDGMTVKVYQTATLATDETIASALNANPAKVTLDKDHLTGQTSFAVVASNDDQTHETTAYYAIELVYDGTEVAGKTLSGSITIAQSFGA